MHNQPSDQISHRPLRLAAWTALAAAAPLVPAQAPSVLRDLDTTPRNFLDSTPESFAQLGSQVVFAATRAAEGRELWTLDPSTGQASLLADIAAGTASSSPHSLTTFAGHVYFVANDASSGSELWRTDGTASGTIRVSDLVPGPEGSFPSELTVCGNQLYFAAYTAALGRELVVTDGTPLSIQVLDVAAGSDSAAPEELTTISGELWFQATTPAEGSELWRSNGTAAGTMLVADVQPGPNGCSLRQLHEVGGGKVAFVRDQNEIWFSDGTPAGTNFVASGNYLTSNGATAYFTDAATLYATDGTPAGTQLLTSVPLTGFSTVTGLSTLGSRILIHAFRVFLQPGPLTFASDGTTANPVQLPQAIPLDYVRDGNTAWFVSAPQFSAAAISRSDGTVNGTSIALQIGSAGATDQPDELTLLDNPTRFVFSAVDATGREPWLYDPVANTGQRLANLGDNSGATAASVPLDFVDAAGTAYWLRASDPSILVRSDGSEAGTLEFGPSSQPTLPIVTDMLAVGTRLFFRSYAGTTGYSLWVSDGTSAGTVAIDLGNNTNPEDLLVAEDLLYFTCDDPFLRTNLWRTDGTQQGTFQVVARPEWGGFDEVQALGRGVVFRYQTFAMGSEPYFNDGTPGGTVMLADLEPGPNSSSPRNLTQLGERLYFLGSDAQLHVTDGTPAGTAAGLPGASGLPANISWLASTRDLLWFADTTVGSANVLWVSDGTAAGTRPAFELAPASNSTLVVNGYYDFGGGVLVDARTDGGRSLWFSDGTPAGSSLLTRNVLDQPLVTGERQAWFLGTDRAHGHELWHTDGTPAGTRLAADLMPGPASATPRFLTLSGGKLLFAAEHPQFGAEPWILELHATSQDVGYGCTPTTRVPPQLWSDDPVRGTTATIHIAHASTPGLGVVMISNDTTTVHPLGSGACDYFVDGGLAFLGFGATAAGRVTVPLGIPNNPALDGQRFRLQALTIPVAGLLAAELSNGVTLTIGQ
ncbi:MAG: ELWxxDGT repeat protein [Planctomycetota bacterium]